MERFQKMKDQEFELDRAERMTKMKEFIETDDSSFLASLDPIEAVDYKSHMRQFREAYDSIPDAPAWLQKPMLAKALAFQHIVTVFRSIHARAVAA